MAAVEEEVKEQFLYIRDQSLFPSATMLCLKTEEVVPKGCY